MVVKMPPWFNRLSKAVEKGKIKGRFDSHTHTFLGQQGDRGADTPSIMRTAKERGISVFAITDHNNCEGINDALNVAGKHKDVHIVPGIELDAYYRGKMIHIAGIGIDPNHHELEDINRQYHAIYMPRYNTLYKKAAKMKPEQRKFFLSEFGTLPSHFGKKISDENLRDAVRIVASEKLAFFLAETVIGVIHRAGGIASLTHPTVTFEEEIAKNGISALKPIMEDLVRKGLDGFEVVNPNAVKSKAKISHEQELTKLAQGIRKSDAFLATGKPHFVVTGGSSERNWSRVPEELLFGKPEDSLNAVHLPPILNAIKHRWILNALGRVRQPLI